MIFIIVCTIRKKNVRPVLYQGGRNSYILVINSLLSQNRLEKVVVDTAYNSEAYYSGYTNPESEAL